MLKITKVMESIQFNGKHLNATKVSQVFSQLASSLTNPSADCIGSLESLPDYVRMSFVYEGIVVDLFLNGIEQGGAL